jgi:hypothetical protein
MPDGSFLIQARSLAEVETSRSRTRRPQRRIDINVLRKLAGMGLHRGEIAARTGFNRSWLGRVAAAHGIKIQSASVGRIDPENVRQLAPQYTASKIAARLGCSADHIYTLAKKHGFALIKAQPPVDPDALRRLAADHMAVEIAALLGVCCDTIYVAAKRHGIALLKVNTDPEFWDRNGAEAARLHELGVSGAQIALRIGTSKNAVIGWLTRHKPYVPRVRPQVQFPGFGECVFPHGEMPTLTFCGAEVEDISKPYCPTHVAECYLPARHVATEVSS